MNIVNHLKSNGLAAGIVCARGVTISPSPTPLDERLRALVSRRKQEDFPPPDLKNSVRNLLRRGGFKPSGRNKPASEYLAQAAREDRFPFINNLVDINNYVSLYSGLPASLLDLAITGEAVSLRCGKTGEKYVFNEAGQEIDLAGLICICRDEGENSVPLGNPVKDSMLAKLSASTRSVLGVIFAPQEALSTEDLHSYAHLFGDLLKEHGGVQDVDIQIC
ncbi:MAG: hypothetical protein GX589_08855 [Deltaproteobacteria bacterium]|nr:hypothetical protein [Deltaproteobacteria bacterium]